MEGAANIQLAACVPNFLILESIERFEGFHGEIVKGVRWEDGYVVLSDEPGLGIEFDEDLARAHPWEGEGLHLQMQEAACDYSEENVFLGGAPPR